MEGGKITLALMLNKQYVKWVNLNRCKLKWFSVVQGAASSLPFSYGNDCSISTEEDF
jgi:hypothetical protein